jgi:hypothetical protein
MRLNLKNARNKVSLIGVLFISVIWVQPAQAQSQATRAQDIQQLKDRLQQLEQTMGEVKGQTTALVGQPGTRDFRSCSSRPPALKPFRICHTNCETGTPARFK